MDPRQRLGILMFCTSSGASSGGSQLLWMMELSNTSKAAVALANSTCMQELFKRNLTQVYMSVATLLLPFMNLSLAVLCHVQASSFSSLVHRRRNGRDGILGS